MLWIKTFHIIFVASWFSGLFYLPRIFVNLAMLDNQDEQTRSRLVMMSDKLFKFMTLLSLPSLILGIVLWQYYGLGSGGSGSDLGWMHIKVLLVLLICVYHFYCYKLLKNFKENKSQRTHIWYRFFNEVPVLLMVYVVALVVNKPTDIGAFLLNLTGYLLLAVVGFFVVNILIKKLRSKTN